MTKSNFKDELCYDPTQALIDRTRELEELARNHRQAIATGYGAAIPTTLVGLGIWGLSTLSGVVGVTGGLLAAYYTFHRASMATSKSGIREFFEILGGMSHRHALENKLYDDIDWLKEEYKAGRLKSQSLLDQEIENYTNEAKLELLKIDVANTIKFIEDLEANEYLFIQFASTALPAYLEALPEDQRYKQYHILLREFIKDRGASKLIRFFKNQGIIYGSPIEVEDTYTPPRQIQQAPTEIQQPNETATQLLQQLEQFRRQRQETIIVPPIPVDEPIQVEPEIKSNFEFDTYGSFDPDYGYLDRVVSSPVLETFTEPEVETVISSVAVAPKEESFDLEQPSTNIIIPATPKPQISSDTWSRMLKILDQLEEEGFKIKRLIKKPFIMCCGSSQSGKSTIAHINGLARLAYGIPTWYISPDDDFPSVKYTQIFTTWTDVVQSYTQIPARISNASKGSLNMGYTFDEVWKVSERGVDTEYLFNETLQKGDKSGAKVTLITQSKTLTSMGGKGIKEAFDKACCLVEPNYYEDEFGERSPSGEYLVSQNGFTDKWHVPRWLLVEKNKYGQPCPVTTLLKLFPELCSDIEITEEIKTYTQYEIPEEEIKVQIIEARKQGKNKDQIIFDFWGAKPGGSKAYQRAQQEIKELFPNGDLSAYA